MFPIVHRTYFYEKYTTGANLSEIFMMGTQEGKKGFQELNGWLFKVNHFTTSTYKKEVKKF